MSHGTDVPKTPGTTPGTPAAPGPPAAPGTTPRTPAAPRPPAAPGTTPRTPAAPGPPAAPGTTPRTPAAPRPPAAPGTTPRTPAAPLPPTAPGTTPRTPAAPRPPAAPGTPAKPSRAGTVAALRPRYQADLAHGTERFFEPRRTDCPWCGSARLKRRLLTKDRYQNKPGRFLLDRCRDCRHVFQNPALNPDGLEFYYRDFYDGLGEQERGDVFSRRRKMYQGRAQSLEPGADPPKAWLDVGTGHGHFPEVARAVFPGTRFDGLDFTDGVDLAERAGRIDHGFRGSFPDLARERLAESYDVVSMFHYLEHSTDPRAELHAARRALRPGGRLLVEVPDPECWFARLFGRFWLPWLQPQHLHFLPVANLRKELAALGFTVVVEQHREPSDTVDLLGAVWLTVNAVAPPEDSPSLAEPPGWARRLLRRALLLAAVPALLGATTLDRLLLKPLAGLGKVSNAYRVVARRD
ncbi:class I SAM-dependent methyltransferase [Streptomyces sp. NPDC005271]|uniref:class I SAM-dependent methyltransferase n=1 Tax=unclassified Streptomyces TaxID=2593676 RepID=UPI0033AC49C3